LAEKEKGEAEESSSVLFGRFFVLGRSLGSGLVSLFGLLACLVVFFFSSWLAVTVGLAFWGGALATNLIKEREDPRVKAHRQGTRRTRETDDGDVDVVIGGDRLRLAFLDSYGSLDLACSVLLGQILIPCTEAAARGHRRTVACGVRATPMRSANIDLLEGPWTSSPFQPKEPLENESKKRERLS
jgi:type IV secretory pathway TrbD component